MMRACYTISLSIQMQSFKFAILPLDCQSDREPDVIFMVEQHLYPKPCLNFKIYHKSLSESRKNYISIFRLGTEEINKSTFFSRNILAQINYFHGSMTTLSRQMVKQYWKALHKLWVDGLFVHNFLALLMKSSIV